MESKRSKKTGYNNDFYLLLVTHIKKYSKLPKLNISKQALNYYIKKLKEDKVLYKKGYALWTVDLDRFDQLKFIEKVKNKRSDTRNIRGHGFHYRIRLPKIKKWNKRERYLKNKKIRYKPSKATWEGYRIIIRGYKIWLCNNSIVIYAPKDKSFYHWTAEESKHLALYELEQLLISIEHKLNIDLKIKGRYEWKVSKNHYGKIKDILAHQMNKAKEKIYCVLNGEGWLTIDHSLNVDEIETVHPKTAVKDMDKIIVPFLNDLKSHYDSTGEVVKLSDVIKTFEKIAANQLSMQSNIEALQCHVVNKGNLDKPDYFG